MTCSVFKNWSYNTRYTNNKLFDKSQSTFKIISLSTDLE